MIKKVDKAKIICESYRNGMTLSQIAKAFGHDTSVITAYLKRYFEYFYGEPYMPFAQKRQKRLAEIYEQYKEIYAQGLYSRTQICELLDCSLWEFECMLSEYKLNNQWLKTYHRQKTLCNVPEEFYKSVSEFAKENGYKSVRAVATQAINEFMLQAMLRKENM